MDDPISMAFMVILIPLFLVILVVTSPLWLPPVLLMELYDRKHRQNA